MSEDINPENIKCPKCGLIWAKDCNCSISALVKKEKDGSIVVVEIVGDLKYLDE